MRRLSLPSSMTIYVAIWPFPCTSFHSSAAADPQTWQVCCGGYWSLAQAVQYCKTSRFWFTASQKGWLKASGTGITFGIVSLHVQGCLWYGHRHCAGISWKAPGRPPGTHPWVSQREAWRYAEPRDTGGGHTHRDGYGSVA